MSKFEQAFLKAQSKIEPIPKNGVNPHYKSKYVLLDDLINGVKGHLNSEGLSFRHTSRFEADRFFVGTEIIHAESGTICKAFEMPIPVGEPQKMGSGITYARRYSLAALLGVPSDEDDDGNSALKGQNQSSQKSNSPASGLRVGPSEAQLKRLFAIAKSKGVEVPQLDALLSARFKIKSKTQLNRQQYDYICNLIEAGKFFEELNRIKSSQPSNEAPSPLDEPPEWLQDGFN